MIVLGIDPGTATTGYGLVNETPTGGLEAIAYGAIRTPPNLEMHRRLLLIYQQLKEILLLHHPSCGAVEKLYFQRNVTTALAVGQARGVILLALAEADLAVAEYSPLEVKQAISGYGGADKHQVQEMTRVLLNLEKIPRPDDAADALAIAICHLSHNRFNSLVAETKDP
jgi:crossover junction endodeoxyribonuclease RuvC